MKPGGNTTVWYMAIVGAFLIGWIIFGHLPAWAAVPLGVAFIVVSAAPTTRHLWRRSPERETLPETLPAIPARPTPVYAQTQLSGTLLPSIKPDYDFTLSASVMWAPTEGAQDGSMHNMPALAADAIAARAREITVNSDPRYATAVQLELAKALGELRPDSSGTVAAKAQDVSVAIPDEDGQRLEKLARVRKEEEVWDHERRHEKNKREYFGKDVLSDPGSAVVWWLSRNENKIKEVSDDISTITKLSNAANNIDDTEALDNTIFPVRGQSAADYFESFLNACGFADGSPADHALLVEVAAKLAAEQGREDIANELRTRFTVLDEDEPGEQSGGELWGEPGSDDGPLGDDGEGRDA